VSLTLGDLLRAATVRLQGVGIEGAARDARLLLAQAAGLSAARLGTDLAEIAGPDIAARYDAMIARRAAREPVSHITGKRLFFKYEFTVSPAVLDPRPETEVLVLAALDAPFSRILDLGTGSGAILLSLLAERGEATGLGTDLSQAALNTARQNADILGLAGRCDFQISDWFDDLSGRFDLIVSNPPYIAQAEMAELSPEVSYEPEMALTDGADGLCAYRAICKSALAHLVPGGRLMVEIGWTQGPQVAALMNEAGLGGVTILPDLDGRDRVISGHAE